MAEIALSGDSGRGLVAYVDDSDAAVAAGHRWHALRVAGSKTIYARTKIKRKTVFLHRLVMGAQKGDEIDHIDGDGLNNRRSNLRFVTHTENLKAAAPDAGPLRQSDYRRIGPGVGGV